MENYSDEKPVLSREEKIARKKRKKRKRILKKIGLGFRLTFLDILLTALFICTFALFHHVIPMLSQTSIVTAAVSTAPESTPETVPTPDAETVCETEISEETAEEQPENAEAEFAPAVSEEPGNTDEPAEAEATPEPVDTRTEWQIKFSDYFTDEVVTTDNSYSSPNVSVTITKVSNVYGEDWDDYPVTYYIADIHIGNIECFKSGAAGGDLTESAVGDAEVLDKLSSAIIQINGDYSGAGYGFVVRNGTVYSAEQTEEDIAVLYYDGTLKTYAADEYNVDDILAQNPYQVWKFGPQLLDENGLPFESYDSALTNYHPRTAIGYYEPGHYCFLVAEGRTETSRGLKMDAMAKIFSDLGCVAAYNLDGGASSVMTFNDTLVNVQSSYRQIKDTLYIADIAEGEN